MVGFVALIEYIPYILQSRLLLSSLLAAKVYNTVFSVKCNVWKNKTQPDIEAVFENNFYIQMIETGFAELF